MSVNHHRSIAAIVFTCVIGPLVMPAECLAQSRPDFNGDGFADLAVGVPGEDLAAKNSTGALTVLSGHTSGITAAHAKHLHQDRVNIPENAEPGDVFGSASAAGDFDGDGFDDLAIGVPGESVGSVAAAGAVHVFFGSADFIVINGNQLWHQDKNGIASNPQVGDNFGAALESGDFNNDGFDDLAIGVPGERVGGNAAAGAVHVLYGSANGLRASGSQFWHQNADGIAGAAGAGDRFGSALCAGDFNNDSFEDLAIGSPFDNISGEPDAGAVNVIYGSAAGLAALGNQQWHQTLLGNGNVTEPFDRFGSAMATGDFDNDGFADLAVTAPNETVGGVRDNGAVSVIYGTVAGLDDTDSQFFARNNDPDSDHIDDSPPYASAIAAGDVNGDGFDELAIGAAAYADIENDDQQSGRIFVLSGTPLGLINGQRFFLHEATDEPPDPAGAFGEVLTMADFNDDGFDDVIIGMPSRTGPIGGASSGAIVIILGTEGGFEFNSGELQTQGSFGESSETGDHMGASLSR